MVVRVIGVSGLLYRRKIATFCFPRFDDSLPVRGYRDSTRTDARRSRHPFQGDLAGCLHLLLRPDPQLVVTDTSSVARQLRACRLRRCQNMVGLDRKATRY